MDIDLMKEYRKIDDNIMLRMNTTDTHSETSCKEFFKHLSEAYARREKAIDSCLKILDARLEKQQKIIEDDPYNSDVKNQIFVDETKRRMIANEYVVEDIVRERSLTVFKNKCRKFTIPEEFRRWLQRR
ncbi:327_t:CDS:2 [Paraglomus occultum]|uniref:327_t:CDS:1 n=1 Tax=Paraglomus occultum TaxID=144539 RepID=A0A9N8Z7N1_9GLOM|nr:327_t:CDS:2 [Paraglomus occultum]